MPVDVIAELKAMIQNIFSNPDAAMQYASDPNGTLAAQGITDGDLSGVDLYQLVDQCATEAGLPESTKQALQSYGGGSASSSAASHQSAQDVVQHLNYVTYQTYEGDEQITQQLINYQDYSTNIDNSVEVEVDGDVHGDLEVETTNVNATGDGAVAAGDDATGVATGDGAIAAGDDIEDSQLNTGDGAVQAGDDINAPVNTGEFTGVQADNLNADASTFNFGDGDVTNIGQSTVEESAIATGGGDANNVADNTLYEGAAAAAGGDATGDFEETYVDAENSIVGTEQGPGDFDQHADLDQSEAEREETGVEPVG